MKWPALHKACWAGKFQEVERLLDAGANPNQVPPAEWRLTPLGRTLEFRISFPKNQGHFETVRMLLRNGADPAVRSTSLDMTPFELAAFFGLEPAAKLLRKFAPATPHPTAMNDLWLAAASPLPEPALLETVGVLADSQDVNAIWRQAPLLTAAGHAPHFQVADRLLKAGANPNEVTSLLHVHFHFEHLIPGLRYLARVGWNVNAKDAHGQTALHKAAFAGYSTPIPRRKTPKA